MFTFSTLTRRVGGAIAGAMLGLAMLDAGTAEARNLDEILSAKKIVVGVNPALPPLGLYNEKNQIDGFDVEFANKIAEMLGVAIEIVTVGANDRIPFLASGKIDVVMGAMTRTAARAKVIDFTLPVHTEILGVLTTAAKPYKKWQDLNDPKVRLVSVRGTTGAAFIQKNLPNATTTLVDGQPEEVTLLAQGRVDAAITVVDFHGPSMKKYKVDWKVLEDPIDVYYCPAGVAKGNHSLRDWLNVAIFELHRSGWIDQAWQKWFGIGMLQSVNPSPYF
jgi:polar amino acid transport system substrate-binding protein